MVDNIGCNLDRYSPKDFESNKRVSLSPDSEPFRNSHGYIGVSNGSNNSNTDMAEITRDETNFCTELARNHPSPNKPRLEEKLGLRSLVARLSSSFEIHLQVHVVQNLCVEVDRLKSEAENHLRTLGTIVTESNYRVILDMFHKNLQISRLAFNENLLITGVLTNSISPTDKDIEDCYDNYVQSIAEYVIHCIWKENPCLPWRLDKYPAFQGKIKRHLIDSLLRDMDYTTFKEDIKFFNRMKWANINIPVDFSQVFLNLPVFLSSHVIFYLRKVSYMLKIFRFELWCLGV